MVLFPATRIGYNYSAWETDVAYGKAIRGLKGGRRRERCGITTLLESRTFSGYSVISLLSVLRHMSGFVWPGLWCIVVRYKHLLSIHSVKARRRSIKNFSKSFQFAKVKNANMLFLCCGPTGPGSACLQRSARLYIEDIEGLLLIEAPRFAHKLRLTSQGAGTCTGFVFSMFF